MLGVGKLRRGRLATLDPHELGQEIAVHTGQLPGRLPLPDGVVEPRQ